VTSLFPNLEIVTVNQKTLGHKGNYAKHAVERQRRDSLGQKFENRIYVFCQLDFALFGSARTCHPVAVRLSKIYTFSPINSK
jgi:hypothetical protein